MSRTKRAAPLNLVVALIVCCASPVLAQEAAPSPEEQARYDAVIKEAASNAELTFSSLPAITDRKTRNSVLRYNVAARAWWVELRCKFGTAEEKKKFETDLALFTNVMDMIFAAEFKKSPREANEYTQKIQMYALNAMSANKFFDCSDKAKDIWFVGISETLDFGDFARKLAQSPPGPEK